MDIPPVDEVCPGPTGFLTDSIAFVPGTPAALAQTLNHLTYSAPGALAIVAMVKPSIGAGTGYIGGVELVSTAYAFAEGLKPTPNPLSLQVGGFATTEPSTGWLSLTDGSQKHIRLENISFTGTTSEHCSRLMGVLTATIAESAGNISLTGPSGARTVSQLAGAPPWDVRALIQASSVSFDFSSLPSD